MKIGILTYHFANNYGAVLQAFALKKYLDNNGHSATIINYDSELKNSTNRRPINKIVSFGWDVFRYLFGYGRKKRGFNCFRKDYLNICEPVLKNLESFREYLCKNDYQCMIVGSDQVWNPYINGHDEAYFLNLPGFSGKRIAYAASFGISTIPEDYKKQIRDLLKTFNSISVREETAKNILNDFGICSTVTLDPVFLLNDEWEQLINLKPIFSQKYILCYSMPGDKLVTHKIKLQAKAISKKTGARIIYIGRKEYNYILPNGFDYNCKTPIEFLSLIKFADCIVTNSFHGTAFSLIFKKAFYSVVNNKTKGNKQLSSRIVDLLTTLKLDNRIVKVSEQEEIKEDINYDYVEVSSLVDKSKKWIDDAIRDGQ